MSFATGLGVTLLVFAPLQALYRSWGHVLVTIILGLLLVTERYWGGEGR